MSASLGQWKSPVDKYPNNRRYTFCISDSQQGTIPSLTFFSPLKPLWGPYFFLLGYKPWHEAVYSIINDQRNLAKPVWAGFDLWKDKTVLNSKPFFVANMAKSYIAHSDEWHVAPPLNQA